MLADPILIEELTTRSIVVFLIDKLAAPAVDCLRRYAERVTTASLLGLASDMEPGRAIALLKAENFDAAIIFTGAHQSPYGAAYLCYLAGIPLRIAQSHEFGGGVLSHCFAPPADHPHWALLQSIGLTGGPPSTQRNLV